MDEVYENIQRLPDIFRTLIVPEEGVLLARRLAESFGPAGQGMWTTGLSPTGQNPATHYISSGFIPAQFGYMVPLYAWTQNTEGVWTREIVLAGDSVAVYQAAVSFGIPCTQADIDTLFDTSDVTEEFPLEAMARLNLSFINIEE